MALQSPFFCSSDPFSSSSSFSREWKYDVFISFRGSDTRYGFTGNLYKALCDKGIHTFFDDDELQSGEEITPVLLNAIENSRIAIIVLSPNYAHSSFCLEELVHILHCIKGNNRLVLPVFYEVDPSDLRHLKNSFGEAMAKHQKRYKDDINKVDDWKKALKEVADLSGYHYFKQGGGYEHKFIGNIVDNISKRIRRLTNLHVAYHLVGLETPVSKVVSLLDIYFNAEVRMVGLHGIGGIGKTTLAIAVYNSIADHFEGVCFLENVRENSDRHGLVHLQTILLSQILGEKNIKLTSSKQGAFEIQKKLCRKKVLLVLDDVDEHKQLEAIAGKPDWFGPGSRIIITTRRKDLLELHGVERTHEVEALDAKQSLEFLTWKAFKTDSVSPEYENVLHRAVTYASGLPLALEVIGSSLFGKDLEHWESAFGQNEQILDKRIREILQKSFDALGKIEQSVFLDIACCFKGYKLMEVTDILQAQYGSSMKYHIGVLVERSLLKIESYDKIVTMHDLIEDMGKEIVQEESLEIPRKRSRLWCYQDIVKVLEDNQGTSTIRIIHLEFPKRDEDVEVKWDGKAFKEMTNLKTLIIKNGYFSLAPKYLPKSLRVLEWWRYPSKYFPYDFQPKELYLLKLSGYHFVSLDISSKIFVSLKVLKFDSCEFLKEIPDVSGLQNLQEFSIRECGKLVTVHSSVGFLPKLEKLNAESCGELSNFPAINLPSLKEFHLSGCMKLKEFPEILGEMENVTELELKDTSIEDLPYSFRNLSRLELLIMSGNKMCRMPNVIVMMPQLLGCQINGDDNKGWVLPKLEEGLQGILSLPSSNMMSLFLINWKLSDHFFPLALALFPNVHRLVLCGNNFTVLPECIQEFVNLWLLRVDDCQQLREIRGVPPNLKEFHALRCKSLSPRGTSLLVNQEVHEDGYTKFVMPGRRIPTWFEERRRGASISFWFRGSRFPSWAPCLAILLKDELPRHSIRVRPTVTINGNRVPSSLKATSVEKLFIFDLSILEEYLYDQILCFESTWNHAEISYIAYDHLAFDYVNVESITEEIGMHVLKRKRCTNFIQRIRFTDPYKQIKLMMMVSIVVHKHEDQPLLVKNCIGLWTFLFLTRTIFGSSTRKRGGTTSLCPWSQTSSKSALHTQASLLPL